MFYANVMLVGHTHDDIDVIFERWCMKLRKNDHPTISFAHEIFYELVILHFIKEVLDFKGFIDGHITFGDEALEGHTNAQQFKFYKRVKLPMDGRECNIRLFGQIVSDFQKRMMVLNCEVNRTKHEEQGQNHQGKWRNYQPLEYYGK